MSSDKKIENKSFIDAIKRENKQRKNKHMQTKKTQNVKTKERHRVHNSSFPVNFAAI